MRHIFKLTSAAIAVGLMTFSAVPDATAKTPPEVLTPYKAYRAALKAGDDKLGLKQFWAIIQRRLTSLRTLPILALKLVMKRGLEKPICGQSNSARFTRRMA